MRNSAEHYNKIWDECTQIGSDNGIQTSAESRRRRLPHNLAQYITMEGVPSDHQAIRTKEEFRLHVYIPIIERVLGELNRRFNANTPILLGIISLQPEKDTFLNLEKLKPLVEHYQCDMDSVEAEIKLLPNTIRRYESQNGCVVNNLYQFVNLLEEYKLAFHEIYKLAVIALTIPASSASCERTFSCMRRLKTYLRNRMGSVRLSNLAVLAVERRIAMTLDMNDVVDKFDAGGGLGQNFKRRINLH